MIVLGGFFGLVFAGLGVLLLFVLAERLRIMQLLGTATSPIAGLKAGRRRVHVRGRIVAAADAFLAAPVSAREVVWYRVRVEAWARAQHAVARERVSRRPRSRGRWRGDGCDVALPPGGNVDSVSRRVFVGRRYAQSGRARPSGTCSSLSA